MNVCKAGWSLMGITLFMSVVAIASCRSPLRPSTEQDPLKIIVSIPPQAYFVERIGGDAVTVNTMVPAGAEPHTYEPSPDQLKALSQADAYLQMRVDFETAWMDRFSAVNSQMLIVDTTAGIERQPLPSNSQDAELQSGLSESGPFSQGNRSLARNADPHVWLSPRLVKHQVQTIYTTLTQLEPEQSAQFKANLEAFFRDIEQLDTNIKGALQGVKRRQFLVFHPAWGYFARDYDLQMVTIEVGGQEPSAAELAELIRFAQQQQIKVVFAAPQFSQRASETIAQEIGGQVLLIDPLAYDWLENLKTVAETFSEVLCERDRCPAIATSFSHLAPTYEKG